MEVSEIQKYLILLALPRGLEPCFRRERETTVSASIHQCREITVKSAFSVLARPLMSGYVYAVRLPYDRDLEGADGTDA